MPQLEEGISEMKMREVFESCRPLYDMGIREFQILLQNKTLKCERFIMDD